MFGETQPRESIKLIEHFKDFSGWLGIAINTVGYRQTYTIDSRTSVGRWNSTQFHARASGPERAGPTLARLHEPRTRSIRRRKRLRSACRIPLGLAAQQCGDGHHIYGVQPNRITQTA